MVPVGMRFELFVEDVERSLAFYGSALGLRPPAGYDSLGYVPVSAGRVLIGLQRRDALPAEHHFRAAHFDGPRGVGVEIVIEVDDVGDAFARARCPAGTIHVSGAASGARAETPVECPLWIASTRSCRNECAGWVLRRMAERRLSSMDDRS